MTDIEAKFARWKAGIDNAVGDPRWDAYDCEIIHAVNEINQHLTGKGGYVPLDWRIIKAMIWVETGANSHAWKTRPMQIGNPGDPGLDALLSGNEGGHVILPLVWRTQLTAASATTVPSHNIRAGIAYLLMKMANFSLKNVLSEDKAVYEVIVKRGDSLDKLARKHNSTVQTMKRLNSGVRVIRPGDVLKYQKSSIQKVIVGWKLMSPDGISSNYNGGGDDLYARKVNYALSTIRSKEASGCQR